MKQTRPLIIAHRGASAELPENSLEAFERAVQTGCADMLEFDIRHSRDGVPVIFHDSRLERTTDGSGYISHRNFNDLKTLDAGFHFNPDGDPPYPCRGRGIKIPSLEELLQSLPDIPLAIEIKENSSQSVQNIVKILESYGRDNKVIIGSKYHQVSRTLQNDYPHLDRFCSRMDILSLLMEHRKRKQNPKPDSHGVASVPPHFFGITFESQEWIDFLHKKNMRAFFWTIDDPLTIQSLKDKGADGIVTNYPQRAASCLNRPS